MSKITFPNKSSIMYNSNSESFVGVGSVVVEEDVSIQDLIDNYDKANERKEKAKLEFEKLNGIGNKELTDKEIPGFGELFRELSYKTIGTSAMQSRACAALANGKYIFALPGSSGGVTDAWDGILKHQLDINHKPCNFVELFPRLKEK